MTDQTSTTQTSQSSSGQQGQSTSPASGGQDGGSQSTQTVSRPEWLPEAHWDPTSNAIKPEFAQHFKELSDLKASHDARLAARPEKPDGYALELPKEFKTPDGLALKFDDKDPRVAELRAFGHEQGWDQATFSRVLTLEAQRVIAETKAVQDAQAAELKKLGTNGPARVTASKTWLAGIVGKEGGDQLMDRMMTATDVELLEKLQQAFTTQGGGALNGRGRETPEPPPQSPEARLYPQQARKAS